MLIKNGANVNQADEEGDTPLSYAGASGNFAIFNFFKMTTCTELLPLTGNVKMIKLLVENGAKLDVKNEDGLTPLAAAAASGNSITPFYR